LTSTPRRVPSRHECSLWSSYLHSPSVWPMANRPDARGPLSPRLPQSPKGLMAPSIIYNNAVQGEVFLHGQIFVFGGFTLRATSLSPLEQSESYAPGHQVRFGSLNYMDDIRGDLIFDRFKPLPSAPHGHDEHDLALPSDSVQETAAATAPTLNLEPVAPSMDRWMDPTMEAVSSAAIEPSIDLTVHKSHDAKLSNPSPAKDSEPPAPVPIESDWAPIMEFTSTDIF